MSQLKVFSMMAAILILVRVGHGMATEEIGSDKSIGHATVAQPGWPKGIEAALRHPSRVYSVWVNGNENFYFQASAAEINELLDLFSKARLRDHEVRIVADKPTVKSFQGRAFEYNVSLEVIGGISLHATREENNVETLEPRLTVHIGDDPALLKQLKLPENVTVSGAVEGLGLKGKGAKPVRTAWYGCVQFEDSKPATERGLSTQITLWEKGFEDGIPMANVDNKGTFKLVLSDGEFADLEKGDAWLTVTVGNFLIEAKKDGAKFPPAMLAREKEKALAQKIGRPKYYYGRILFPDGSPAVLDPKPWPGAQITVDFAYAGSAEVDAEGYFQVHLEPAQIESLKTQKARKNIYRPRAEPVGESVATDTFPADLFVSGQGKRWGRKDSGWRREGSGAAGGWRGRGGCRHREARVGRYHCVAASHRKAERRNEIGKCPPRQCGNRKTSQDPHNGTPVCSTA